MQLISSLSASFVGCGKIRKQLLDDFVCGFDETEDTRSRQSVSGDVMGVGIHPWEAVSLAHTVAARASVVFFFFFPSS